MSSRLRKYSQPGSGTLIKRHPEHRKHIIEPIIWLAVQPGDLPSAIAAGYPNLLLSYWFLRNGEPLTSVFERRGGDIRNHNIMVDSGSYSITASGGRGVDLDQHVRDFVEFVWLEMEHLYCYVNLDLQFKPELAMKFWQEIAFQGLPHAIHVHHRPEPWKFWDLICRETGEISGLSPMPRAAFSVKVEYFKKAYALNPSAKAHWFGSVDSRIAKRFPCYSADSSAPIASAMFGQCKFEDGMYFLGSEESKLSGGIRSWYTITKKQKRKLEEECAKIPDPFTFKPMKILEAVGKVPYAGMRRKTINCWWWRNHIQEACRYDPEAAAELDMPDPEEIRESEIYQGWESPPPTDWK